MGADADQQRDSAAGQGARRRLGRHLIALAGAAILLVAMAEAGGAQAPGIVEIPLTTVVRTDPGVHTLLASFAVPEPLVGQECLVESRAENNSSVHPGNDLIVSSGAATVLLRDVEGEPGMVSVGNTTVTLGETVVVTLVMGEDGVFSAGASAFVVLECFVPTTTTTTTSTSTTTTSTTTIPTSVAPTTIINSTTTSTTVPVTTVAGPSTSVAPPTTVPTEPPQLAITGPGSTLLLFLAGVVLLDLGYLALSAQRSARRELG